MERLIFTDLQENNNKFWHGWIEGTTVKTNWGRVGDTGQFKDYPFTDPVSAQRKLDQSVSGKLRKGYTRQQTIGEGQIVKNVAHVAKTQIEHGNNPETAALIDFLIKRNIHAIEGTTNIRMEAGRLTTPLGPVTLEGLDEAERLLARMATEKTNLGVWANQYLRIVPRNIGRKRVDPADLFGTVAQLQAEQTTIDTLRAVVKDAAQKANADAPVVFKTKLSIVDHSNDDFRRIAKMFSGSRNSVHATANLRLHAVWEMELADSVANFNTKIGNIKQLWHGTKDANLLSILKSGYVIPKSGGSVAITGRMFGDGVYFSDQSTKSLNYATSFWGGSGSQRTFMLLNDVAMGREYMTRQSFRGSIPAGYDSCFAKPGIAPIRNNEMIVYNLNQINPRFLCEFR